MNHRLLPVFVLAPVTLVASPAGANWISGGELERHCSAYLDDPSGTEGAVCAAFVQGYVSAAGTQHAAGMTGDGDFAMRAARTRVGSRLRSLREDYAARRAYCVDGVEPAAVVEAVALHMSVSDTTREGPPAREVHRALVAKFPCSDP